MTCLAFSSTFAQAPNLGTASAYTLYTTDGAVSNTGLSHVTGDVGTNNGSNTGFGNVNGNMHAIDASTVQCAVDVLLAYQQLDAAIPDFNVAPFLGNGDTLAPGVYAMTGATILSGELYLDAAGQANNVYIFQVDGALAANPGAHVHLLNGAQACNVFWKVEGMVNVATLSTMRGTIIANNAAISFQAGDTLEGRALSTTGAISIDGVVAYTPMGCGSPVLLGPPLPALGTTECYALFSAAGTVTNTGLTGVRGDVGSNNGVTTGFDPALVFGTIHLVPDSSTNACATDLNILYATLNALVQDIELLYPAQLGAKLVLTPHTYLLDAATTLTDTLYLDAQGQPNAVFVFLVNGALSTGAYANVVLRGGAQAQNVFWRVEGAVEINTHSQFVGTIVCHNGALMIIGTDANLDGRALTTDGALSTASTWAIVPTLCSLVGLESSAPPAQQFQFAPNPFGNAAPLHVSTGLGWRAAELSIYDSFGRIVLQSTIPAGTSALATDHFAEGVYAYRMRLDGKVIGTGKLLSLR